MKISRKKTYITSSVTTVKSSNIKGFPRFTVTDKQCIEATPKRQATGSNPAGGAKNDRCKPFFDGLQRFFVIVFPERSCRSAGTILYIFRCMPANWLRTIFPVLLIKNADLLIRFSRPIFRMGLTPAMWPVCWPVPATCEAVPLGTPNPMWRAPVPLVPPGDEPNAGQDWHRRRSQTSGR